MNKASEKNIFQNLSLPAIAAPMFLISNPAMVIGCCKNGIIGSFPALNQRTSEGFEDWLKEITAALDHDKDAPYAVNLIVNPANARLEDDLKLCVQYKVPIIITSLGINPDLIKAVHSYGGLVFHDVTTLRHAKKAADAGVDGLIAVCAGAGGHAGTLSPFAFVSEIRSFFEGYLALAGSISSGADILASQVIGADFAYMGTRFIGTDQSAASPEYKAMLARASAVDIIYTDAVSGVPANFIRESLEAAGIDAEHKGGKAELKSMESEIKAWKNIWSAGHGVGATQKTLPIQTLIEQLKGEYAAANAKL